MLTRRIRLQVTAFIVIALVGISYVSVRYVGLQRLVGASGYTVHLELADSGGIFSNAEVTYRGVTVGRVGSLELSATGVVANLHITSSRHIPADLKAVVADRSAIGEQYVDLRPNADSGPYLKDGTTIPRSVTTIPPPVDQLLYNVDSLSESIPTKSLNTVINELSSAVQNSGQSLQVLLDAAGELFPAADKDFTNQAQLIDSSATVLATQQQESASIKSFSANLALIASQLRSSDPDLRKLISTATPAAQQVNGLISDIGSSASVLISNLLTTSQIFLGSVNGVREVLVRLPQAVSIGSTVVTAKGVNVGLSLTFFDPLPCTNGYRGTVRRNADDVSAGQPLNTSAGCLSGSSDVRGSQNAPALTSDRSWVSNLIAPDTSQNSAHTLADLLGGGY
jgi:phospholipid/cholesterol/gamma-HCH transport system substrate-binding protein